MKSHKKGIISLFYCGEYLDKDQDLNPKNLCIKCAVKIKDWDNELKTAAKSIIHYDGVLGAMDFLNHPAIL